MSRQRKAQQLTKAGLKSLLGIFLDTECPICDRSTPQTFCIDCSRQIKAEYYPVEGWSLECTEGRTSDTILPRQGHALPPAIPIGALGLYQGNLKQAILALKYKNCPTVAAELGIALAQRWLAQPAPSLKQSPPLIVIPIPLHANRLKQRGYNQAALIAQSFCRASGLPLLAHGLNREQDTLPQHGLGVTSRQENLACAFTVGASLLNRFRRAGSTRKAKILLIDDIYTTGATTQSAAKVLLDAGFPVAGMLSLAKAVQD